MCVCVCLCGNHWIDSMFTHQTLTLVITYAFAINRIGSISLLHQFKSFNKRLWSLFDVDVKSFFTLKFKKKINNLEFDQIETKNTFTIVECAFQMFMISNV